MQNLVEQLFARLKSKSMSISASVNEEVRLSSDITMYKQGISMHEFLTSLLNYS